MFCSNCGKELVNEAKFCSNCGAASGSVLPSGNAGNSQSNVLSQENIQKAENLRDKAEAKIDEEKYDEALALCRESVDINPDDAITWAWAGLAAGSKGDYDDAIKYFSISIELEDNATVYYWRGNVYFELEDYDHALGDFNDAIRRNHSDAGFYSVRGNTYYNFGDFQNAILDYQKALKINPNDETTKENLTSAQEAINKNESSGGGKILSGIGTFLGAATVSFLDALSNNNNDDDDDD